MHAYEGLPLPTGVGGLCTELRCAAALVFACLLGSSLLNVCVCLPVCWLALLDQAFVCTPRLTTALPASVPYLQRTSI